MSTQINDSRLQIAQISHELKNPVAFINSSLQLLSGEHPEITKSRYWKNIMEEFKHLHCLLNDLCSLHAGSTLFPETVAYDSFAANLLDTLLPSLLERQQNLCLKLPHENLCLSMDKHKIRQVLENLIQNASDASPAGSTIYWKISTKNGYLINEITDRGKGISATYEDSLFQPFFTSKSNGTGLGLPICREIIESHQGALYFYNNTDSGATFGFQLPL